MVIEQIQEALRRTDSSGWLFFDHHRRDPLAYRVLQLPPELNPSRRWYYFIPAQGKPIKLVHEIEGATLDSLPGNKESYSSWTDQHRKLQEILSGHQKVVMQYSPNCAIPYVSMVDAGTLELIRSFDVEVVSSADLLQEFEARWSEEQLQMHLQAGRLVDRIRREAFELIGQRIRSDNSVSEHEVQQFIRMRFAQSDLITDHGPNVSVNANASNPHYEPSVTRSSPIKPGDFVLIDLWAKLKKPEAVYYDVTWTGFCGNSIPTRMENVFAVVKDARRKASSFVIQRAEQKSVFAGYEVDDAARTHIQEAGLGEYFFHRTGHSIGVNVHGAGANMDNLESHDERRVIPQSCFSIEPGVYLPEFGVRSEINVYVGSGFGYVTGEEQESLVCI